MKNLLPILAFALIACTPQVTEETAKECCPMVSPLDEFASSPRRFRNNDSSEVVSSSLVKLGPGITASRPSGAPGEATFVTLDVPEVATQAAQIAALQSQVSALQETVSALVSTLNAATSENTPGTLVKRDVNGDIFTANFRGNVKEASNGEHVKILAYGGQEVVRFGSNGGNSALRFFDGGTLVLQQNLSASDPDLAVSIANTLEQFGFVTISP